MEIPAAQPNRPACFVTFKGTNKSIVRKVTGVPNYNSLIQFAEKYFADCTLTSNFEGTVFSLEDDKSVADFLEFVGVTDRLFVNVHENPPAHFPTPPKNQPVPVREINPAPGHFILVDPAQWLPKPAVQEVVPRVLGSWKAPQDPLQRPAKQFSAPHQGERAVFFSQYMPGVE